MRTLEKKLGHSVEFTVTHDLRDTRAILPPILNLKEPYLLRAGQTNVEMKLIMKAEIKTSAKLLVLKNNTLFYFMGVKPKHIGSRKEFHKLSRSCKFFLKDGFGFKKNKI